MWQFKAPAVRFPGPNATFKGSITSCTARNGAFAIALPAVLLRSVSHRCALPSAFTGNKRPDFSSVGPIRIAVEVPG
jgi:hypothetical protein